MSKPQEDLVTAIRDAGVRHSGMIPRKMVSSGTEVVRSVKLGTNELEARRVAGPARIPNYRWGGPALYTSLSVPANMNEFLFYQRSSIDVRINGLSFKSRGEVPAKGHVSGVCYKYRLVRPVEALIYSPEEEKFQAFLSRIDRDPGVIAAKKDARCFWNLEERLWVAIGPPLGDSYDDYAVTRAVGTIGLEKGFSLLAPTARTEIPTLPTQKTNLVIRGEPEKPISILEVKSVLAVGTGLDGLPFSVEREYRPGVAPPRLNQGDIIIRSESDESETHE